MSNMQSNRQPKKVIPFDEVIRRFQEYKDEHGDLYIPISYVTDDGFKLGVMVNSIRSKNRKVTPEEKKILDDMGFIWRVSDVKKLHLYHRPPRYSFEEIFDELIKYKKEKGDLLVPHTYITESGMKLGYIVSYYRNGTKRLTTEQVKKLDDIGFVWRIRAQYIPMNMVFVLFKKYKNRYGDLAIPLNYVTPDGIRLGNIARNIKKGARQTTDEQRKILIDMGFKFNNDLKER